MDIARTYFALCIYPNNRIWPGTCSDSKSGLDQIVTVKHRFPTMWLSDPLCHKHGNMIYIDQVIDKV